MLMELSDDIHEEYRRALEHWIPLDEGGQCRVFEHPITLATGNTCHKVLIHYGTGVER